MSTELNHYRLLSPSAGVRVSPICLGTMSLGKAWEPYMGTGADKEAAFKILDVFFEAGGNFVDTSNNYQNGESESFLGQWMSERKNRDQIVVATKYTMCYAEGPHVKSKVNYQGNHKKSLHISVRDSLEKLQTDYIDILYVHWWDYTTSIPELMQSLDTLVKAEKVLYLGVSDTPAWIVSKANEYARLHGMAQFVVYQGLWSLHSRDLEREILPMCRSENMAIVPWGVLGQGKFKSVAEIEQRSKENGQLRHGSDQTEQERLVVDALSNVAKEIGGAATITSVAIAWIVTKSPNVYPALGGQSVEHLMANMEALKIKLTVSQITALESVASFELGFPYNLFGIDPSAPGGAANWMQNMAGIVKYVKQPQLEGVVLGK